MKKAHDWRLLVATLGVLCAGSLTACGESSETTTLHVYAAASLKVPFEQLGERFEDGHDDIEVAFNFAGSSDLVAQIANGAPADVFASADETNMTKLVDDGLAANTPDLFATNTLTIAVPPGNPAGITSLEDLTGERVNLVVCAPQVPCGAASERVEAAADLDWTPRSEEQSVTDVLNKVIAGEADAGLVYVTDVINAGDKVESIDLPETEEALNNYPIAAVNDADQTEAAQEFIELVLSDDGRGVLDEAGFGIP